MGDLKLFLGVGAWIGASQLFLAVVVTQIVGGIYCAGHALWRGRLVECLDQTGDLLAQFAGRRLRPPDQIRLINAETLSVPYVPAPAPCTIFSFFAH